MDREGSTTLLHSLDQRAFDQPSTPADTTIPCAAGFEISPPRADDGLCLQCLETRASTALGADRRPASTCPSVECELAGWRPKCLRRFAN